MGMYSKYAQYLHRHIRYVRIVGRRIGVPSLQLAMHDASKWRPDEFFPYAHKFYGSQHVTDAEVRIRELRFQHALLRHYHRNPHHWNHYVLLTGGSISALQMPRRYVLEMLADWAGAGLAQGSTNMHDWYDTNREKLVLHPHTASLIEYLLPHVQTIVELIKQ